MSRIRYWWTLSLQSTSATSTHAALVPRGESEQMDGISTSIITDSGY